MHPQALLLPGRHRASVGGAGPLPLCFWLSTRLLHMKQDAADRFMRDTRGGCNSTERFVLLHHTLHHGWPVRSGKTVLWLLWPRPPMLDHRRMASLSCFIFSKQTLHLVIQKPCRSKEESKNW